MVESADRRSLAAGVGGPAVLLATFGVGAAASPAFTWPTDPFSAIGAGGGPTATLFNAGVTLGGLAHLPFAVGVWRGFSRLTGATYAVVGVAFAGAGLFPAGEGARLHQVFGAAVFLGIPLLLWVAGSVDWRAGDHPAGAVAVVLGAVALLVWLPYDLGLTRAQIGYGAAELVSLLAFACWSVWTAVRLWDGPVHGTPGERTGASP